MTDTNEALEAFTYMMNFIENVVVPNTAFHINDFGSQGEFKAIEQALQQQAGGEVDGVQGSSASQQVGGRDYMSLSDAKRHWRKYIDIEMRDPCGLNADAKAALTLLRNLSTQKPEPVAVDWEYLGFNRQDAIDAENAIDDFMTDLMDEAHINDCWQIIQNYIYALEQASLGVIGGV